MLDYLLISQQGFLAARSEGRGMELEQDCGSGKSQGGNRREKIEIAREKNGRKIKDEYTLLLWHMLTGP